MKSLKEHFSRNEHQPLSRETVSRPETYGQANHTMFNDTRNLSRGDGVAEEEVDFDEGPSGLQSSEPELVINQP